MLETTLIQELENLTNNIAGAVVAVHIGDEIAQTRKKDIKMRQLSKIEWKAVAKTALELDSVKEQDQLVDFVII